MVSFSSAFLAVVLATLGPAAAEVHTSPSGKHLVTFEQTAHRTFDPRDEASCPGADERSPAITREQFYIGGATLGKGEVRGLIEAFGEPLEVRSEETEAGPDTAKTYVFDGVEAYAQGDEVLNVECTNPAYPTPDGARVGDRVERMFEIYGVTEPADAASGPIFGYPLGETDAILMFHVDRKRVTKIELWLNYT